MSRLVEFRKNSDRKVFLRGRFEILEFINSQQQGGQAVIAFAIDHDSANRFLALKLHGLTFKKDETSEKIVFYSRSREYAERTLMHEKQIMSPLGDSLFPSVPMYLDHWIENDVPILAMTLGKESSIGSKDLQKERFNLKDFQEGSVLTLEQIIYQKAYYETQKHKIDELQSLPYSQKLGLYLDNVRIVNRIHKDYKLVLNDIKPGNILIITPKHQKNSIVQVIDFGSSIPIQDSESVDAVADLITFPTTLPYSDSRTLIDYWRLLNGKISHKDYIVNVKKNPSIMISRDIWALCVTGMEFVLGRHPYLNIALELMLKDEDIVRLKKYAAVSDEAQSELNIRKVECYLMAHKIYFDERMKKGYYLRRLEWSVPAKVEQWLHRGLSSADKEGIEEIVGLKFRL